MAAFLGLVLPGVLLNGQVMLRDTQVLAKETAVPPTEETQSQEAPLFVTLRQPGGFVSYMNMNAYLMGVILAEMPASFELEALKAQAVAARTYAQKASVTGGKHGDGSVCTKASCCQAYIAVEEYLAQGGTEENAEKIRRAVIFTDGQVLTYAGELIEATYFACSGGYTEDAVAVWGTEYPYLKALPSHGEEHSAGFMQEVSFTSRQFQNALGRMLNGHPESWFGETTYTEGGGVASMTIGGQSYTGTELRSLLNLRSTAFSVTPLEDGVVITTYGHGHRVGMSQYGADAMAVQGSNYREILAYYYPGTELVSLADVMEMNSVPD